MEGVVSSMRVMQGSFAVRDQRTTANSPALQRWEVSRSERVREADD